MSYYHPPPPYPPPGPPKKSWAGRIALGALITIGATLLGGLGVLLPSSSRLGLLGLGLLVPVLCLVIGIVLVCIEDTRPWGLGMIIGFFVMLIVGAGACVALIAGLNSTHAAL